MSESEELQTIQTVVWLVETVPMLQAEKAALEAQLALSLSKGQAQAKALQVILAKVAYVERLHAAVAGESFAAVWVEMTRGEIEVMRRAVTV